jgi:hypothetical protein
MSEMSSQRSIEMKIGVAIAKAAGTDFTDRKLNPSGEEAACILGKAAIDALRAEGQLRANLADELPADRLMQVATAISKAMAEAWGGCASLPGPDACEHGNCRCTNFAFDLAEKIVALEGPCP